MPVRVVHNLRSGVVSNVRVTHKSAVKRRVNEKGASTPVRIKSKGTGTTAIQVTHEPEAGVIA